MQRVYLLVRLTHSVFHLIVTFFDPSAFRESRYFKTWKKLRYVEDHMLMTAIADITGQRSVPFGDAALLFR